MDNRISHDDHTTVASLRRLMADFVGERDWQQFHSPKNLSMSLAIEAAELMEHFQWIEPAESRRPDPAKKLAIGEELADVLCYAFAIANELDIDIASTMQQKMQRNRVKYPADQYRGRYGPDDRGGEQNAP